MSISNAARLGAASFAVILGIGLVALPFFYDPLARAEPVRLESPEAPRDENPPRMRVIDGDTIEDMAADITYRLVNIDTPETGSRAQCTAERALGNEATQRAHALVNGAGEVELRPTGRIDRYGRTIAYVLLDGRDLGETLIAQGLARPWRGRREPWCGANGELIP